MPSFVVHKPTRYQHALTSSAIKDETWLRTRNRLLPILQLYPDIVEYIFLLAVELEHNMRSLQRSTISYSQTCHDWRLIALSVKRLWSHLVDFESRSLEWNEEMLRRSDPLPIRLSFHSHYACDKTALRAQLYYLDRIQTYSVACPESNWGELVEGLKQPAPQMRSLYITCYRTHYPSHSTALLLPSSLFAGYAPCLSHLEFIECLPDFRAPVLASITSLRIVNVPLNSAPTVLQWLEYLSWMPKLTVLVLEGAVQSSSDYSSIQPFTNRHFPLIADLHLDAPLPDVNALLQNLPMRADSRWSLRCINSRIGPHLDAIMRTFMTGVSISYSPDEPCPLLLAAWNSCIYLRSEVFTSDGLRRMGFYVNFELPRSSLWDALFPAVASQLVDFMPRFSSLELHLPYVHPSIFPCLYHASQLETFVKFSGTLTRYLLPELQSPFPTTGDIPLPALKAIIFTDDKSIWGANYQALLRFLRWRAMMGAPIERIKFVDCFVLEDTARELEGLGVNVVGHDDAVRWQNL